MIGFSPHQREIYEFERFPLNEVWMNKILEFKEDEQETIITQQDVKESLEALNFENVYDKYYKDYGNYRLQVSGSNKDEFNHYRYRYFICFFKKEGRTKTYGAGFGNGGTDFTIHECLGKIQKSMFPNIYEKDTIKQIIDSILHKDLIT